MKNKIFVEILCFLCLLIANSCNKGTEFIKWRADKSIIDYREQNVTIHVEDLDINPDFAQSFSVGEPYYLEAVPEHHEKNTGRVVRHIYGPWFKFTIPPNPVKQIEVHFSENKTGEQRSVTLIAGGPCYGKCVITQTSE